MSMDQVEVIRAACCIAGLDAHIHDEERRLLEQLAHQVGVGRASLEAMIDRGRSDRTFYEKQFKLFRGDPEAAMKVLFTIAMADGELSTDERVILQHFAEAVGLSTEQYDQLLTAAEKQMQERGGGGDD